MLDMDGTVLDLAYDNYMWKELFRGATRPSKDRR